MRRQKVLGESVLPVEERLRLIEQEELPANMGSYLESVVAAAPDSVAWNFFESGETILYSELLEKVDALCYGMMQRGIRKGTHVAVMLPNIAAFPLTWLALARLGAVMVPVNIAYTAREFQYIVENGDVEWLVIHQECLPVLEEFSSLPGHLSAERILSVGVQDNSHSRWEEVFEQPPGGRSWLPSVELDDPVNIQYTSGTTGFPKGCILTHRYWLTISKANARRDGRVYKRILAPTPFFYMDPQWLLLMALYSGGTLYVARRQSTSRFMEWVRRYGIHFCLMPYLVHKQPESPDDRNHDLIRVNVYGMPPGLHVQIEERFDLIVREAFGMTEAGACLFMPIEATEMVGSGSCGRPGPFREARIVDDQGKVLPAGEVGELQVRGPGVMQGYYKNSEATQEAFDGDWFRTGDLFRQDEKGYFYIVGRVKDMIRRSGENIAAREVEAVLNALKEVSDSAAVPVPDEVRGEEVKVYVRLQPGMDRQSVSPDRIVEHCRQYLAPFKVPRYIQYVKDFPRTPSGKIAKNILTRDVTDLTADSYDRVEEKWL